MLIKKTFQGEIPENKIVNSYSESQTDTYSCDYINNNSSTSNDWTLLGTISRVGSSYGLNIPSNAKEIFIETFVLNDMDGATIHILTNTLKESNKGYDAGFFKSSSDMMRILIYSTKSKVWVQEAVLNSSQKSTLGSCYVYYK